jgi:hypothetical protein
MDEVKSRSQKSGVRSQNAGGRIRISFRILTPGFWLLTPFLLAQTTVPNGPVTGGNAKYPAEGPAYAPSAAAVINAAGTIDAAVGPATNCVLQNGTTAPCGAGGSTNAVTLQGRALASTAPTNNQVVLYNAGGSTWQPAGLFFNMLSGVATDAQLPTPGGDVSGTLEGLTVSGLQGRPVSATAPLDLQALVYSVSAGKWQPANQTGSSSSNATTLQGRNLAATAPTDGQALVWNNAGSTWQPGGIYSFNGRKGAVAPATADYTAAQVTNAVDATQTYADPVWLSSVSPAKVGNGVNQWNANKINNQALNLLASGLYYFTLGVPSSITGNASDCVHVDGSSGACGSGGSGAGVTLVDNETPGGTVDGSNRVFTLAYSPNAGSLKLYLNGVRMEAPSDYTLAGFTLTFTAGQGAPPAASILLADYEIGGAGGGPVNGLLPGAGITIAGTPTTPVVLVDQTSVPFLGASNVWSGLNNMSQQIVSTAINRTTTGADWGTLCDTATAGGPLTITLPLSPVTGAVQWVKNLGTSLCTIGGNGKNIDGAATYTGLATTGNAAGMQYDGTQWRTLWVPSGGAGGGASITSGAYPAPGTCTHTSTQSDLYLISSGLIPQAICTATNTWSYQYDGYFVTPAALTTLTSALQSGVSVSSSAATGYEVMTLPASGSTTVSYRYWTAPSAPYTQYVYLRLPYSPDTSSYHAYTVGFMDGTGAQNYLHFAVGASVTNGLWALIRFGTNGASSGNDITWIATVPPISIFGDVVIALQDDNTNLHFGVSGDGGASWVDLGTVGRTAHFGSGPTKLFYGGYNSAAGVPQKITFVGTR